MNRAGKEQLRVALAEKFNKANAAIVAEYSGLSVGEMSALRVELRKVGAEFKVLKNRVALKALADEAEGARPLAGDLKGPIGVAFSYGDVAQTTKTILEFAKDSDKLVVRSGLMEERRVDDQDLKAIADLPSREVLLGQIVGSLIAPHRGLVSVLAGVPRQLVQVINAIKDTKST